MAAKKKAPPRVAPMGPVVRRLLHEATLIAWQLEDEAKRERTTAKGRTALRLANLLLAVTGAARKPDEGAELEALAARLLEPALLDLHSAAQGEDLHETLVQRVGALRVKRGVEPSQVIASVFVWIRNESAGLNVPDQNDRRWLGMEREALKDVTVERGGAAAPASAGGAENRTRVWARRASDVSIVNACLRALGVVTSKLGARLRMRAYHARKKQARPKSPRNK